jgi:hypothetical protein
LTLAGFGVFVVELTDNSGACTLAAIIAADGHVIGRTAALDTFDFVIAIVAIVVVVPIGTGGVAGDDDDDDDDDATADVAAGRGFLVTEPFGRPRGRRTSGYPNSLTASVDTGVTGAGFANV